jgi:predicted metal-dependent HD superfamily phosphohydrolase
MAPHQLTLAVLPDVMAICRLEAGSAIPRWATSGPLFSITRTDDELSVACLQALVPEGIRCERDWRCLRVAGPIPFSAVGVLAALVAPLAEAGISVFSVSTFDTDYLLVKAGDLDKTIAVLRQAGQEVQCAAMEELRRQWRDLLHHWAVDPIRANEKFKEVSSFYREAGRFYHTLDHIGEVLHSVDALASKARFPEMVKLSAWLHDVIYDSKASDNEERSARYAEKLCEEFEIPEGRVIAAMILKTKTHDAEGDTDAQILIDADLAILGATETEYRAYAQKIQQEYAWVPQDRFNEGRRRILEGLLARPRIYHWFSHLEGPARRNMAAEIARLAAGSSLGAGGH